LIVGALLLATQGSALAVRPPSNYACLAKEADSIAIVQSANAPKLIYMDFFGEKHFLFELDIQQQIYLVPVLKKNSRIYLLTRRGPEEAWFEPGVRYLVFLANAEQGPRVLDGGQGAIRLEQGKAELHGRKLSPDQLKTFVSKAHKLDIHCNWHGF
jgi:hypothetical protein